MLLITLYIVLPLHLQSLKMLCSMVKEEEILQENYLTLDLRLKLTQNVAHYPLHNVIYAPAKFEVATSNGLADIFT